MNFSKLVPSVFYIDISDGLKLFVKETTLPGTSNIIMFVLAPTVTFILSLVGWAVIPFSEKIVLKD